MSEDVFAVGPHCMSAIELHCHCRCGCCSPHVNSTLISPLRYYILMMFTSPHLNQAVAPQTPAMAISSHANFPEKSEKSLGDKPGNEATVELRSGIL